MRNHIHFLLLLRGDVSGDGEGKCGFGIGKTPGPVHELGDGYVDSAVDVPGRDPGGPEQGNDEGNDVHAVALQAAQGVVGAPGEVPFDVIAYPVISAQGIVVKSRGFGCDGVGEDDLIGFRQKGRVVGAGELVVLELGWVSVLISLSLVIVLGNCNIWFVTYLHHHNFSRRKVGFQEFYNDI